MGKRKIKLINTFFVTSVSLAMAFFVVTGIVIAQQSSSTNYGINEFIFGAGGSIDPASTNYSALATIGETAVGNLSSTTYQAYGGFQTTDLPFLEMLVASQSVDMGILNETTTGSGTATFSVKTYLASGYTVTSTGGPPTLVGDTEFIDAMAAQAASSQGTSQFGFNLTSNTTPTSFGADPVQVPSSSFSFGAADNNYDDTNLYRYVDGEQIAYSNSSSGETDYTIAYIMNVEAIEAAGLYRMLHAIIATSTF